MPLNSKVDIILTIVHIKLTDIVIFIKLSLCIDADDGFNSTKINGYPLVIAVACSNPTTQVSPGVPV